MADARTTRSFAYDVEASAYGVRNTRSFAYSVEAEEPGVGTPPTLRVGNIREDSADLSVDPLSEYLEIRYQTRRGVTIIDDAVLSGPTRFVRSLSGLPAATEHISRARVRREAGWSPWSSPVTWTTLDPGSEPAVRGCPPLPIGNLQNPDGNPPNFPGRGWYVPYPGQPLRGVVTCVLRFNDPAWLWDIHLSDDAGQTYSLIVEALEASGDLDGDQLELYRFSLDTTELADGMNYRLRATSAIPGDDEEFESLTFAVDNAEEVYAWRHDDQPLDGRFGKMWAPFGSSSVFGVQDRTIWVRGRDGGIGALANHPWALFADRDIPQSKGGDVTIAWYIWSGEGGFRGLGGRDDTEGLHVGAGFFARGLTTEDQSGLFVGAQNPQTWPLGCCDDVYTSTSARVQAGIPAGETNLGVLNIEGGGLTNALLTVAKMFFKKVLWPEFISRHIQPSFPRQTWRDGPGPGDNPVSARTCIRRYEMYAQRIRVEEDPTDDTRVRIRTRLDGPGVETPASGYWHFDQWVTLSEPLGCGALGLVSRQLTSSVWSEIYGARVFLSWSAKPLDVCGPVPEIPPEEPPPFIPPTPGEPCTLVLQVFEEDRETLAWEVGTDTDHPNPYLALPEHYGEQEIDVVNGAASIGQVEVIVIDPSQTEGDQDSGWLTERLSEGGVTAIHGTRCRLVRYISTELGWVVIADGPATHPRMDESYSGYRWTIRDTRETERKVRAFVETDTSWLLPMGVPAGFGAYVDEAGDDQWLVAPQEPLTGEWNGTTVSLEDYWPNGFSGGPFAGVPNDPPVADEDVWITEDVEEAMLADAEPLGDPRPILWTWPELEILWRVNGSGDPWTVVHPNDTLLEGENVAKPAGAGDFWRRLVVVFDAEDPDGNEVRAVTFIGMPDEAGTETLPEPDTIVDVAIRRTGPPTEWAPQHIEYDDDGVTRLTTGRLLQKLYDGEYSDPDPVTGEFVPTGIRYDEAALLQMTDPVLLRVTEVVKDARSWAEERVYAPTGWIPALDNDGRISPVSQVPPEPFVGDLDITDEITEPVPDWDAGERVVNVLTVSYPRYYPVDMLDADSIDALETRDVEIEFRDESSVTKHSIQAAEYDASAFAAIGDVFARPVLTLEDESGWLHSQDRKLYVFDRFRNGAQIVQVPVMRSLHVHVPELIEHHSATLRAGDWVTVDLSWFPDYVTRRRGMETRGQVIAINDVDCAWRVLLIEEVLPLPEES